MHRRLTANLILATAALATTVGPAYAKKGHKAHEHGAVKLSIAIDGTQVTIAGEIPGDDAFGFEHAARNAAEKQKITDSLATFRTKGTELFQFPVEAGCTVKEANVKAPMEASLTETPKPAADAKPGKKEEEHQDVDVDYAFTCQKSPVGGTLKLGLLKAFPSIKTVRAQVVSGANQSGTTVHNADEAIKL